MRAERGARHANYNTHMLNEMTEQDWWDSAQAKDIYHWMKKHQVAAGCQTICQINRCHEQKGRGGKSHRSRRKVKWMSPPKKNLAAKLIWPEIFTILLFVLELHIFWMPREAAVLCETRSNVAMKLLRTSACVLKVYWGTTKTELWIYVNKFIEGLGDLGWGAGTLTQYSG